MTVNPSQLEKRRGRARLRRNKSARYPISSSPLWRLRSLHVLATLLQTDFDLIEPLCLNPTYRRGFESSPKPGKDARAIQVPTEDTMRLHYRLLKLLDSIERPEFLHSATKKRSHVTNARAHTDFAGALVSVDIRKFFESTTYGHIKRFFHLDLGCSHDVARYLASLCTADGHLPTGSCISSLLSYFVHQKLFNEIASLCHSRQVTMSLYVDDLTFSGLHATKALQYEVGKLVRRAGLRTHPRKNIRVRPGKAAIVTGVVVHDGTLKLRNLHHQKIIQIQNSIADGDFPHDELAGRMAAARAIDPVAAGKLHARLLKVRS